MHEADAAAFLPQVEEHTGPLLHDALEGRLKLFSAIASARSEDVAGEALRMDPDHHGTAVPHVAVDQGDVLFAVDHAFEGMNPECPMARGQTRFRDLTDQALGLHPILDEIADGDHADVVLGAECLELRNAHHGAVGRHDFADHTRGLETGQPRQVHRGFGLARAHQNTAILSSQREHVSGACQIFGARPGIDRGEDRGRAIRRRNARGGSFLGLDRDTESRAELRGVLGVLNHQRDAELIQPLSGERQTDQATTMSGHEVDGVGGDLLGRDGEVALVLAILIVDHNDHAAASDVVDGVFDGGEGQESLLWGALENGRRPAGRDATS